jgi:hypothetical protein
MSRSRKHTPKGGITTAASDKDDKRQAHQRERRRVRVVLAVDPAPELLPHRRELSDPWAMAKDGKTYYGHDAAPHVLRK